MSQLFVRFVRPDGNDGNTGENEQSPWKSLQKASEWVNSLASQSAAVVHIGTGTYAVTGSQLGLNYFNANVGCQVTTILQPGCTLDFTNVTMQRHGISVSNSLNNEYYFQLNGATMLGPNGQYSADAIHVANGGLCHVFGVDSAMNKTKLRNWSQGFSTTGNQKDGLFDGLEVLFDPGIGRSSHSMSSNSQNNTVRDCDLWPALGSGNLGFGGNDPTQTNTPAKYLRSRFLCDSPAAPQMTMRNATLDHCQIGSVGNRVNAGGSFRDALPVWFTNCFVAMSCDGIGNANFAGCWGHLDFRIRGDAAKNASRHAYCHWTQNPNLPPGPFQNGSFDGGGELWTGSRMTIWDSVFLKYQSTAVYASTAQRDSMNQATQYRNCCIDEIQPGFPPFPSGLTVDHNTLLAAPNVGPQDGVEREKWVWSRPSPCVGAGWAGDIGLEGEAVQPELPDRAWSGV